MNRPSNERSEHQMKEESQKKVEKEEKIVDIHIYCINKLICVFVKTFSLHLKSTNTKLIQKFITFHYFYDTFCLSFAPSRARRLAHLLDDAIFSRL